LLWGGLASLGFYTLIHSGTLNHEFFQRYFAGHWVEYVTTTMFFVAVAQLVLRASDVADQRSRLHKPLFDQVVPVPRAVDEARILLEQLDNAPRQDQEGYLPCRLRKALESIRRKESADFLDDELKYLAEADAGRSHASYALVRIIIWAIPILGFLGTVIGITMAIARLSPQALENSLSEVTSGLGVAFDTTALALALSMALMFIHFFVDQVESRLLAEVDACVATELGDRFEQTGTQRDAYLATVERMAEAVVQATERTVQRQAEIWHTTIDAAHDRWNHLAALTQEQLETALAGALVKSVEVHAQRLTAAEEKAAEQNHRHWLQVQEALAANTEKVQKALETSADAARSQQSELSKQSEVLLKVVDATGQITRLEEALNRNLAAVATAQHFEETMLNLSAAIHLLNARLGQVTPLAPKVALKETSSADKAA
jgi:biopolymer transport protein ExbB/TolQ